VHGDHTGGNEHIAKQGAAILARENLRARLLKPAPQANGQPARRRRRLRFPSHLRRADVVHMNGEDVQLVPVPVAHTDGDTMVYFPNANVIMTGDFYRSTGYPNIDRGQRRHDERHARRLRRDREAGKPDTKVIPGHGAIVDKAAVTAHKQMMMAVRDKVAALVRQNKSQEEVVAAKVTAEFDSKVTGATPQTADRFVTQLYQELKATR
jgi:glyoxylase-like metal-dependent hydrolase (beta-lactamase superfamily II)